MDEITRANQLAKKLKKVRMRTGEKKITALQRTTFTRYLNYGTLTWATM